MARDSSTYRHARRDASKEFGRPMMLLDGVHYKPISAAKLYGDRPTTNRAERRASRAEARRKPVEVVNHW